MPSISGRKPPTRLIRPLGLDKRGTKRVTTSQGICDADKYEAVQLTIQGRDCPVNVDPFKLFARRRFAASY